MPFVLPRIAQPSARLDAEDAFTLPPFLNSPIFLIISLSIICTTGTNAVYSLYKIKSPIDNPISNSSTGTEINNSVVKYHLNTSYGVTIDTSNAELLYSNYFTSNESLNLTNLSNIGGPIYLTAGINATNNEAGFHSDYLVLKVIRLSSQEERFYGSFNWIEV